MTTKEVDLTRVCGLGPDGKQAPLDRTKAQTIIALKLAAAGYQVPPALVDKNAETLELASDLFRVYREQSRLLQSTPCPIDQRIQAYLNDVLSTTGDEIPQLPSTHLAVDRYGIAKELSFPLGKDEYHNSEIDSYRLSNGVLHNPLNDKRTTAGVFHVADYGLPIPADKIPVPLKTYGRLLAKALQPPEDLNTIAYTSEWEKPVVTMVSLHLRPLVCPEVPGVSPEKRSEVRFFVPGSCTANLDFVENIFGNGGDSRLPENDAGLDTEHWTGTTGCVILAPHLRKQLKKEMGLPHVSEATEKQKANGMCWSDPNELYNGGSPFKITCRDERGIMVTILADNYFGYCKKEVKTQIGLSANIFGVAEEEHAGGALAFKAVNLGEHFKANPRYMQTIVPKKAKKFVHTFEEAMSLLGDTVTIHPEGYATDNKFNDIHFLPEDMELNVQTQTAKFTDKKSGELRSIRLLPNHTYVHPCGYKVLVNKHPTIPKWKLTGVLSEPTFCHKPSTVSGGGKSEISKSLTDAVIHGPIFIGNYEEDMAIVEKIVNRDYSNCLLPEYKADHSDPSRPILSMERTLGSVIKLLTPDDIYTEEHNKFLESIPSHIFAILFAIKSNYKADMGSEWRKHFTVDITNGSPGHELKFQNRQLVGSYLRVGFSQDGTWRNYKMRQDFIAASKVQMEDDITASVVVPREQLKNIPEEYARYPSLKISRNCEWRLFQRPDDAIHPGYDTLTEFDMASPDLFCSNFQPLRKEEMKYLSEEMYFFDKMTKPMQKHMTKAKTYDGFNVCSAKPRMVDGAPTKNPRYLQVRPDVNFPKDKYLAELGARLYRRMSVDEPVVFPVAGVLSGRRNNPPDELNGKKIRPLCVFNPLHYQELPELLMDYVCCVTGKSPSTTGAGSEGALSKGPFNAIGATADLNNMLISMILTGYGGFSSAAGYIGPKYKMDHDFSLIVPEMWCRMTPEERDPDYLIKNGFLEKIEDFEYEGRNIPASRLGYRMTKRFSHYFFCRIFDNPTGVFTDEMLRPETQNMAVFVDGIENIAQAMEKSALKYFEDGIIEDACPPLRAVLHCMAYGHYKGKPIQDPEIRAMFTREALLKSNYYRQRLVNKQKKEVALIERQIPYLESFLSRPGYELEAERLNIKGRLEAAKQRLAYVKTDAYVDSLVGTLGADPLHDGYKLNEEGDKIPTDIVA